MREALLTQLTALRLPGIAAVLEEELARAEREGTPVAEVIERLFAAQIAHCRERRLVYRLAQANPRGWKNPIPGRCRERIRRPRRQGAFAA